MLVRHDLVDRADRGARDAAGEEARLDLGEIVPGDPGGHERVGVGAVLEPRGGRGEPRILVRLGHLDRLAEAHERLIAGAGHRDPSSVAGPVDIGGHHEG